jgi:hypothetical protein
MNDLLSAIRSLRRAPGHAIASLLTLGLGIGAVTELVLSQVRTMADVVSGSLAAREFPTLPVGAFAGAAFLLATMGLYGVLGRLVRARERGIGISRAIGADQPAILRLVIMEGMVAVLAGGGPPPRGRPAPGPGPGQPAVRGHGGGPSHLSCCSRPPLRPRAPDRLSAGAARGRHRSHRGVLQ